MPRGQRPPGKAAHHRTLVYALPDYTSRNPCVNRTPRDANALDRRASPQRTRTASGHRRELDARHAQASQRPSRRTIVSAGSLICRGSLDVQRMNVDVQRVHVHVQYVHTHVHTPVYVCVHVMCTFRAMTDGSRQSATK
jgi:hypothetical protein